MNLFSALHETLFDIVIQREPIQHFYNSIRVNGIAIAIAIAATVTAGAAAIFCHDTQGVSRNEYSQRDGCQRGQ